MPFAKVDSQADFVHLEHDILAFWERIKAFETLRKLRAGKPVWSFLDGPITANNPMGVHHAWGRTYKDVFQRYFAMTDHDLRWQNGFDCQGLWVEVEVEKQLGLGTKKAIEDHGIDKFVAACKARVNKYARIQTDQSVRLGFWMDWDRTDEDWARDPGQRGSYFTMADENNYTIWSFLKKCHERGFIYKSTDVMPWSGKAGCAYSHMEIAEGRKLKVDTSVFVRFPLRGRDNEYLLIWTTTPWTLPANTGAAVGSEIDYVKLRMKRDGAVYYFAKDNLNYQRLESEFKEGFGNASWPKGTPKLKTLHQILNEHGGYEIEDTVLGKDLIDWTYDGPFDELPAQQQQGGWPQELTPDAEQAWKSGKDGHRVIDPGSDSRGSAYVVTGEGTGIVHTAPGCGDVDHVWGKQFELVAIAPLDEDGRFIDGFGWLTGKRANAPETTQAILDNLREKGLLVASEEYPHIYPHCWRTGDPLVYRLVDEWFISMDWRDEIKEVAQQLSWLPPEMKGLEREMEWLGSMRDWMISKKRYWGLALPIWECPECGWYDVIGGKDELKSRAIAGWDEFDGHSPHRPFVDGVKIRCEKCGVEASRVPDVGNPWLDAGIVTYSTTKYNTDREYWQKWIPADLITECFPGQFRNWFYALLTMSTMMEHIPPTKNLLGHALVMDEDGRAMHKSDGTAIWFEEACEQIGVDVMRWMYCAQPSTQNLNFGRRHPDETVQVEGPDGRIIDRTIEGVPLCRVTSKPADDTRKQVHLTLWNSYAFFSNYARLDNWDPKTQTPPVAERQDIDRWILSDLQLVIRDVRQSIERYELSPATVRITRFLDNLSNWYIRRNRRRFWRGAGENDADKHAAYATLYEVLVALAKVMAPIIPFVTESMYQNLVVANQPEACESVHHCIFPEPDESLIDAALSRDMNAIIRLVSMARSARTAKKLGVRQPLATLQVVPADDAEGKAAIRFRDQILEELNVKSLVVRAPGSQAHASVTVKPNFQTLGRKLGKGVQDVAMLLKDGTPAMHQGLAKDVAAGKSVALALPDGRQVELSPEDLVVETQTPEHLSVIEDGATAVILDTTLDDALLREGLAREFVRKVQDLRKRRGLEIEDRIDLRWDTAEADLVTALNDHADYIAQETLATTNEQGLIAGLELETIDLKKQPLRIQLRKAVE